jgi:hypothetical protein
VFNPDPFLILLRQCSFRLCLAVSGRFIDSRAFSQLLDIHGDNQRHERMYDAGGGGSFFLVGLVTPPLWLTKFMV